jgi:hypothetical protein
MTKSPFEIRQDLLNFASSQLNGDYYAKMEKAREITNEELRLNAMANISYPTAEDIFELAEKLKAFVDRK